MPSMDQFEFSALDQIRTARTAALAAYNAHQSHCGRGDRQAQGKLWPLIRGTSLCGPVASNGGLR